MIKEKRKASPKGKTSDERQRGREIDADTGHGVLVYQLNNIWMQHLSNYDENMKR